jgi:hypothetical protein
VTGRPVWALLINENIGGHATAHHHLRTVGCRGRFGRIHRRRAHRHRMGPDGPGHHILLRRERRGCAGGGSTRARSEPRALPGGEGDHCDPAVHERPVPVNVAAWMRNCSRIRSLCALVTGPPCHGGPAVTSLVGVAGRPARAASISGSKDGRAARMWSALGHLAAYRTRLCVRRGQPHLIADGSLRWITEPVNHLTVVLSPGGTDRGRSSLKTRVTRGIYHDRPPNVAVAPVFHLHAPAPVLRLLGLTRLLTSGHEPS